TDVDTMADIVASEALLGRDAFCMGYIEAYRSGKLG
ncbi:MAG: methyltetrahydrofolate cobalamin methyltransferase, partial [Candidatus Latescibacterota bacterium]